MKKSFFYIIFYPILINIFCLINLNSMERYYFYDPFEQSFFVIRDVELLFFNIRNNRVPFSTIVRLIAENQEPSSENRTE